MVMSKPNFANAFCILSALALVLLLSASEALAQQETIISKLSSADGYKPFSGVIPDGKGNFFGTAWGDGADNYGTVYEVSPAGREKWTTTVLHSFNKDGVDGVHPFGSLIRDAAGNLYGTTSAGGTYDYGTVFELTAGSGGTWNESVIFTFPSGGHSGVDPRSSLVFDAKGNLYGTTYSGGEGSSCGSSGCGVVFELTPTSGGEWTETVLHDFDSEDGGFSYSNLVLDSAGNLYGTSTWGGTLGDGTVFEVSPGAGGSWTETVLYSFGSKIGEGVDPYAGLILDTKGNLYGVTYFGGSDGYGSVFELTPGAGGEWTETILHSFSNNGTDGSNPYGGLAMDSQGNLYGTTLYGGPIPYGGQNGYGIAFELKPSAGGVWTEVVLHDFSFSKTDGYFPLGGVTLGPSGLLYGTTSAGPYSGGTNGGTVFQIKP
jgi:uncharacterized repeat protein (TIGR03803 family)